MALARCSQRFAAGDPDRFHHLHADRKGRVELSGNGPGHGKRAAAAAASAQPSATEEELFSQNVKDIYFDYDKSDIRSDHNPQSRPMSSS